MPFRDTFPYLHLSPSSHTGQEWVGNQSSNSIRWHWIPRIEPIRPIRGWEKPYHSEILQPSDGSMHLWMNEWGTGGKEGKGIWTTKDLLEFSLLDRKNYDFLSLLGGLAHQQFQRVLQLSLKKGKSYRRSRGDGVLALQACACALMEHYIFCHQENDEDTKML